MTKIEIPEQIPAEVQTVGAMMAKKIRVKATCMTCRMDQKVNLAVIARIHGAGTTLIDRTAQCRAFDCNGLVSFWYFPIGAEGWLPLISRRFMRTNTPHHPMDFNSGAHTGWPQMSVEESSKATLDRRALARKRDEGKPAPTGTRRRKFGR